MLIRLERRKMGVLLTAGIVGERKGGKGGNDVVRTPIQQLLVA